MSFDFSRPANKEKKPGKVSDSLDEEALAQQQDEEMELLKAQEMELYRELEHGRMESDTKRQ